MTAFKKATTTVSTKGQVILPKAIREQRHWEPGTRLLVENIGEGVLLRPATVFAPAKPNDVYASLHRAGPPKTLKQMEAGIAAEARRRHARAKA